MKNFVLYFFSIILICSCLTIKNKKVCFEEIRPIAIPKAYDSIFIRGSEKIEIENEYYFWASEEKVYTLNELVKDTQNNITRIRKFYSDTTLAFQEISKTTINGEKLIGEFIQIDKNSDCYMLVNCDQKKIERFHDIEKLNDFEKIKKSNSKFLKKNYGIKGNKVKLNFDYIVYALYNNTFLAFDSTYLYPYNLILKDGYEVEYFALNYDLTNDSIQVVGEIVENLKPIVLSYSDIKPLINRIDSVEKIDDYIEIISDSNNNDLLLKITSWKNYKRTGEKNTNRTKVIFHINANTGEVKKISEKKHEIITVH